MRAGDADGAAQAGAEVEFMLVTSDLSPPKCGQGVRVRSWSWRRIR